MPVCKPYFRRPKHAVRADDSWTVPDLVTAYQLQNTAPANSGTAPIGILEMGGGWKASDIAAFCHLYNLAVPTITDVPMDLKNTPGGDADTEVALDIEVVIAAARAAVGPNGLVPQIRIYWSSDMTAAVKRAAADGCATLSISWGAPETQWTKAELTDLQLAVAAAAELGMTVFAASGDNDSTDGTTKDVVDGPACCPAVVACGGTAKIHGGAETVWNDGGGEGTGGGYSKAFSRPTWQVGAPSGAGRMVPDVAANADPNTGYRIYVNGAWGVVGGTSAVAPLYAGFVGVFGRIVGGGALPKFWGKPAAFADITVGNNGTYRALAGPDPCTGLGVPIGPTLAAALKSGGTPVPPVPPALPQQVAVTVTLPTMLLPVDGSVHTVTATVHASKAQ